MPPPARLKDIAAKCGVSVATVSIALNGRGEGRFGKETIEKVQQTAKELGYEPLMQSEAKRLVMRRFGKTLVKRLVALLIPERFYLSNYYNSIFDGLSSTLAEEGFGVLMVCVPPEGLSKLPPSFGRDDVDGLIALLGREHDTLGLLEQIQAAAGRKLPVVSFQGALPTGVSVSVDVAGGAAAELLHLHELGHRRFLYFRRQGGALFGVHQHQMLSGYREACESLGIDADECLQPVDIHKELWEISFVAKRISMLRYLEYKKAWSGCQPLLELLKAQPETTAILAPNDASAIYAYYLLKSHGYRVPEDISIAGFDDAEPLLDKEGRNILTSVKLPLAQMGRKAAKAILERVLHPEKNGAERILLPVSLVARGTTGPAPKRR